MPNRAERRKQMRSQIGKNKQLLADYSRSQLLAGLIKNGITPDDVQREYDRGFKEGVTEGGLHVLKDCYAGIILALSEEFGFDNEQCYRAISVCDKKILYAIEHEELVDEVLDKTGLVLNFSEPMDRIMRADNDHAMTT